MSDKEDSETTKDRPRSSEPTEVEAAATEPAAAGGHDDGWIDIASVNQGIHQPGSGGTTDAAVTAWIRELVEHIVEPPHAVHSPELIVSGVAAGLFDSGVERQLFGAFDFDMQARKSEHDVFAFDT